MDFNNNELNIIKKALCEQYDKLRDITNMLDEEDGLENAISFIRVKQEKIEEVMEKVNDLIVFGTTNSNLLSDIRMVLIDSFDQLED